MDVEDAGRSAFGEVMGCEARRRVVEGLCLAAAPTFAGMAIFISVSQRLSPDMLCADLGPGWGGMVPMYRLMSVLHSAPWLRLALSRRRMARRAQLGCAR
jgi:hypothetical protein